ncbi:hypothetical protein Pan97_40000 [Bremerella volcania]|uniref:Uncharacterized protein n=1 Tax=Bremerella volcania TaxID=2527984 RepID=A0A518CCJ0_9BACT|nr:hypothetical protein [Bremerella volcania]QDU76943.1 hypothetical protein Pan97_40000 [Bremerella volcania]
MFMPSSRNWEEMKYESAGCWPLPINGGDEYALVTKMAASTIKAAYRSCPVSLTVARAETPKGVVLATTLKVADDPAAPLMLSGVLRHEEEQLAIENILRTGKTLVIFFDELSRPVARAECDFTAAERNEASAMIDAPGSRYAGPWIPLLSDVLDEVQGFGDPQLAVPAKYAPTFVTIPLTLSGFETQASTTIGMTDVLDFRLDDPDEGGGLEQSTWHLLENLFEGRIIHSPHVCEASKLRELTDILTHCDAGMCLFESKVAAMLTTSLDRSTERREKSVQKQIDKGIDQLVGAMRNLGRGLPLVTKDGVAIELPSTVGNVHQGVVMVSEMLPGLDWEGIGKQLIDASKQSGAMLHVLDLRELRMLVGVSKDDPMLFAGHLAYRFDVMTERNHAMLRTRLDGPPMP